MKDQAGWHPIGLSSSVEPGSSAGVRLFGSELVVWRDLGGLAHVWEDRCPHRGMKLSFGFVRGDHIACLYHGWQYDRAGICRYIPAHPDLEVPKTITVPVYPVREQAGMIWTALENNPQELAAFDEEATALRSLYLDCDSDGAIAALGRLPLPGFTSTAAACSRVERLTPTLYSVTAASDQLWIGVQIVADGRTALHIAIAGPRDIYQGAGQRHFLGWAMALRDLVERAAS